MDFNRHKKIELRYYTDNWGPFSFDFSAALPSGAAISAQTVKAFLGVVLPGDVLADQEDISSDIIDEDFEPYVEDETKILLKLRYPADDTGLKGEQATLIFEITTDSGAMYPFYFHGVYIL